MKPVCGILCGLLAGLSLAGLSQAAEPAKAEEGIRVLLAPSLETTLVSQMAGRVVAVQANLGERFTRGQVLVRLDCSEQLARLHMSEAEFAAARDTHEAKVRLQGLQQASELEVATAASNVARARAQIDLQRTQAAYCTLAAPFAGRVVKLSVKSHQGVTQGQPLLEIVSDGPLKLRLNAPAKWAGWLKPGTGFEVQIDETGKRYKARVTALNGRVDAVSQTIELEGVIAESAPELLPGMSGTARFAPPS
ncbi:efflux RND transporter periplasmic adaptor subunit [Uliginosibacterium paludis]|uniref:Efflux RND transporter periplasmic adaptor subunit n=1 Tax=Uliginosibacterium paludis TaxID=1615952 RepID=A0ABV2CT48_9RHOO